MGLVVRRDAGVSPGQEHNRDGYHHGWNVLRTDIHIGLRRGALSEASDALQRARWSGLESWPAVEPNEVHGPLLVYTGTRDGNVVRKLQHQRASIEATGGKLHVLEGLNHIELLTANGPVSDVVAPQKKRCLREVRAGRHGTRSHPGTHCDRQR